MVCRHVTVFLFTVLHVSSWINHKSSNKPTDGRVVRFVSGATLVPLQASDRILQELSPDSLRKLQDTIFFAQEGHSSPVGQSITLFLSVIVAPHSGQSCNS